MNMRRMHWGQIAIGVVVLGAAIAAGYAWTHRQKVNWEELDREVQAQKAEVPACRARLAQLYKMVSDYRKDHKGEMPGSFEALYPKYVRDPGLFVCPTAQRWLRKGTVAKGVIRLNGKDYPATYGFMWLTGGYRMAKKREGDRAPLISCVSHGEALYQAGYRRPPMVGAFSPEGRARLADPVREAPVLAVRTNGTVDELTPEEQ